MNAVQRILKAVFLRTESVQPATQAPQPPEQKAYYRGGHRMIYSTQFDGEKNLGELGPIIDYFPNHEALRIRSWQSFLESEVAQTVLKKFVIWIIGKGLKLQAEPAVKVLESEGFRIDSEAFNDIVEARFATFAGSSSVDYSGQRNLNMLAKDVFTNAITGGDILVIQRYEKGQVTVQTIDGALVQSPRISNENLKNGNTISDGIELSPAGEHVAYYVRKKNFEYERIPAKNSAGLKTAFLVYGMKYRLNNHRGLPMLSAVLETIKKMERYKEATVGSAEEVAKIAWQVTHQIFSTGENPIQTQLAKAFNANDDNGDDDLPVDIQGNELANRVAATTNKTAVNNPPGAEVKPIAATTKELYFKDFYTILVEMVCSALTIPPNVAMSKYDSNFSASRAALKDWEHSINVFREEFSFQFYGPVYHFWLHTEILKNKIPGTGGYLIAFARKNNFVLSAYRVARFVGASVPHIDPVKEVNAERLKLGSSGKHIPLTTVEAATEALNGGDSGQNMLQYSKELQQAKDLDIKSDADLQDVSNADPDPEN